MASDDQDQKMVEMLQKLQADIDNSVREVLSEKGVDVDRGFEVLNWEDGARGVIQAGPCASQGDCIARCKPNVVLCATDLICEADHICGYRCRIVQDQCGQRICYSQPH
ncbi:hypothetical protein [Rhodobium gokarnense]|uniref:Uncharacterized protein involved in tellurium resistance n=1 Tax=Rhodobium gokarnense TaxID=364296 RepID=A0ABT3HD89_9HYPH|nr:hypothetical protein [Rhodobium gokarnense]MCW2308381.1 uncharacterized protein involved in tellurium resistance [Rhodobium gokarnense]